MRLLVLSDSHGHIERLSLAVEQANPAAVLHLGNHIGDARKLREKYPDAEFYMVKGNCDIDAAGEKELVFTLEGVKILMAHGHTYKVKSGLTAFAFRAREADADIALYGHTHKAMVEQAHGIWFMNPGQMERHDAIRASYGVVDIDSGNISMELKELA
jgi:putative phosphoesterase